MNGTKFVELLQRFELPDAEKLNPADFDWIFLHKENKNISRFWEWISNNYNKSDLLTDQELKDYKDLVEKGLTFSPDQLKEMEQHFGSLSFGSENPLNSLSVDYDKSEKEVKKKEEEIKQLQHRLDFISIQKMEVRNRIEKKKEKIRQLEITLEMENRKLYPTLDDLSKSKQNLFNFLQETVGSYEHFSAPKGPASYFSQHSLAPWHEEEERFQDSLRKLIDKQFGEGIHLCYGIENDSSLPPEEKSHLPDTSYGPKNATLQEDSKELNRITRMLEHATVKDSCMAIENSRKSAELEEAFKILKMTNEKSFSTSSVMLDAQTKECEELIEAHNQDLAHQVEAIKEKATMIAQTERTNTLLGNYKDQLKKQKHFLAKQTDVIEEFAGQLARYDLVKIIYDIEKEKLIENFDLFLKLSSYLSDDEENSLQVQCALEEIRRQLKENPSHFSKRELELLHKFLPTCQQNNRGELVSLVSSEKEYQAVEESQMISIQNLLKICSLLKKSLFGSDKLSRKLPASWLNPELGKKGQELETRCWDFQQDMLTTVKDIQLKKQSKSFH